MFSGPPQEPLCCSCGKAGASVYRGGFGYCCECCQSKLDDILDAALLLLRDAEESGVSFNGYEGISIALKNMYGNEGIGKDNLTGMAAQFLLADGFKGMFISEDQNLVIKDGEVFKARYIDAEDPLDPPCEGCYFIDKDECLLALCDGSDRKDDKNVVWEKTTDYRVGRPPHIQDLVKDYAYILQEAANSIAVNHYYIVKALKEYGMWSSLNSEDKIQYSYRNVPRLLRCYRRQHVRILRVLGRLLGTDGVPGPVRYIDDDDTSDTGWPPHNLPPDIF